MALKQIPVIDAAEATQQINYHDTGVGLNQVVQLSGSNGEQPLSGKLADRPPADSVPPGTTYWAVDRIGMDDEDSVSDGTVWTLAPVRAGVEQVGGAPAQRVITVGRRVSTEPVLLREVRTSTSTSGHVTPPNGARGFIAYMEVFTATGSDFTVQLRARWRSWTQPRTLGAVVSGEPTPSDATHVITWAEGAADMREALGATTAAFVNTFCAGRFLFDAVITGNFAPGEGIDCEVNIEWLF